MTRLGTTLSAFAIASQNAVEVAQMGVATGLGAAGRAIGATLGSAGFGSLLVARIGADPVSPQVLAGAVHDTFFAAVLVLLVGAVLVLPLRVAANVRNPEYLTRSPLNKEIGEKLNRSIAIAAFATVLIAGFAFGQRFGQPAWASRFEVKASSSGCGSSHQK